MPWPPPVRLVTGDERLSRPHNHLTLRRLAASDGNVVVWILSP
jgi:hypothetical protein